MILRLHHAQIGIPPGAEDRAIEFYCGVLGLRRATKPKSLKGRGGLWLQVGDMQVHVAVEDADSRPEASRAHLAYLVDDLAGWKKKLRGLGLEIRDGATVLPIPGYDRFYFRDPFGNRVELLEKRSS